MRQRRPISPLAVAALSAVALAAPAHADRVGTAGAVNVNSAGEPPGGESRVIEIGAQVVENERIRTSDTGSVQVLFVDKTTLNVGPNSNLVIDRFVYNPVSNRGEVALSLGKGVLRVVGGFATHTDGAMVRTPTASIGVRGGIATITHGAKGTLAILGFGHMTVTNVCSGRGGDCVQKTVEVSRPGYGVIVAGADEPPSAPSRASAEELTLLSGRLGSQAGQTGGSPLQPTDTQAAGYQIGTPNSPVAPIPNTGMARRATALAAIATATQQTVQQAAQVGATVHTAQSVIQQALASTPPTPVTPPTPPVNPGPTTTYAILTTGPYSTTSGTSPVPYLTGAFAGSGVFTVSPILGYQKGGFNANGTPDTTSRQFQAGLSVTGQGASQNATLFVMTSEINNAPNIGYTQAGGFTAMTMSNSTNRSMRWYGVAEGAVSSASPTSAPNTVPNVNGTPNASYTLYNATTNLDNGTVSSTQSYNYTGSSGASYYSFNPITTGTPTLIATNHPNLTLQGYVGGVATTATGGSTPPYTSYTNPYIVTNATGSPGDVSLYLPGNSSQMGAVFNVTGNGGVASLAFGSYNPSDPNNTAGLNTARGAYVNPSNFAARAATVFDNGANLPVSTRSTGGATTSYGYANQLLVTANSVGANTSAFLTSISSTTVTPCNCESTQWGFWSAVDGSKDSSGNLLYEDQGVLLLWVAGVPAMAGALPATGTATYTGHAIADIATYPGSTGGLSYLAAGTFTDVVNFGRRTGAVTIGGLDGATYTGTVNLTSGTALFGGAISGPNSLGRTATLAGSFFQGGATNSTPAYGEMGGSLSLTGPSYLGSGIFLARKP